MTRNIKKTDRDKSWNRRPGHAKVYALKSRETNSKKFLIICEGENTEPCYFKSFPVATASVEAFGLGSSKTSLVKQAIDFVSQEDADPEREVWIVFDMDFDHLKDKSLQKRILMKRYAWRMKKDIR